MIRLVLNHPEAEIVFANSESNAGNLVSDVHEGRRNAGCLAAAGRSRENDIAVPR